MRSQRSIVGGLAILIITNGQRVLQGAIDLTQSLKIEKACRCDAGLSGTMNSDKRQVVAAHRLHMCMRGWEVISLVRFDPNLSSRT
jgi:hypothetical protein